MNKRRWGEEGEGEEEEIQQHLRLTPRHLTNVSARSGREVGETRSGRETEIVSVLSPRNLSLTLAPHISLPLSC